MADTFHLGEWKGETIQTYMYAVEIYSLCLLLV